MGPLRAAAAAVAAVLVTAGCTSSTGAPEPERDPARAATPERPGCAPVGPDDVRGRRPRYLPRRLDAFPNDQAMCTALWLPRSGRDFVPQGLAVAGRVAHVSGYDGGGGLGTRLCRVLRVDLRTGRLLSQVGPVTGQVGPRPSVVCRHGGGLLLDRHGLWLVEKVRLWLLDPGSLAVRRAWALEGPVRGSFTVHDAAGRLGLGGFRRGARSRLHWFDPARVLADGVLDLSARDAVEVDVVPPWGQGAVHADLGPGAEGVWFATSHTYCGHLAGPGGRRRGFLPGAEGIDLVAGGWLWAVSESAARPYQREGGRPVVPMLARFDAASVGAGAAPDGRL